MSGLKTAMGDFAVPGRPSRVQTLERDAVDAVRTLTQNLTRLSRTGTAGSSRRVDFLRLATFFSRSDAPRAHELATAAFGLFGARHLGGAGGDDTDPVATLGSTVEQWRAITGGLTNDQLTNSPVDGEWSVAQITGHLLDVDIVYGFRWRLMLTEDNPSYPGYDEKLWTRPGCLCNR